jgi:hypothetical protein
MKSCIVFLTLQSVEGDSPTIKTVNLGKFSARKAKDWQSQGKKAVLWKEIVQIVADQYLNDKIIAMHSRGSTDHTELLDFTPPPPPKRGPSRVILGYGPYAGRTVIV